MTTDTAAHRFFTRRAEALASRMIAEIKQDLADGTVPTTVATFADLHDHVDANGYGGLFDHNDYTMAQINAAQDIVNEWLEVACADGPCTDPDCGCQLDW